VVVGIEDIVERVKYLSWKWVLAMKRNSSGLFYEWRVDTSYKKIVMKEDRYFLFFFAFVLVFDSSGGRLIQLIRRYIRTDQALFPWESNPIFPGYVLGRSLPLEPKQI
jgi:hypothetical protein